MKSSSYSSTASDSVFILVGTCNHKLSFLTNSFPLFFTSVIHIVMCQSHRHYISRTNIITQQHLLLLHMHTLYNIIVLYVQAAIRSKTPIQRCYSLTRLFLCSLLCLITNSCFFPRTNTTKQLLLRATGNKKKHNNTRPTPFTAVGSAAVWCGDVWL